MHTPILGSAYIARSVNAACNRQVNLYAEIVPEGGKEPAFLNRAPGLSFRLEVGTGPIRGMHVVGSNLYVVSGNTLYKVPANYTIVVPTGLIVAGTPAAPSPGLIVAGTPANPAATWIVAGEPSDSPVPVEPVVIGTVSGSPGPVSMADNGNQLFIACNGPSYIYNSLTDVFAEITDEDFPGAVIVTYLDGYFVFNEPNSQKIWITGLLDGASIDPLDFASSEGSPDNIVGVIADHRETWVFGTNSVEVWYNSGAADFPLARIQGAFNEIGCDAAFSIAKMDNGLFWLGRDNRGNGIVYRANGYTGQRISTHAVEWQIQQYAKTTDAIGYTYQQDGHSFYVLTFPTASRTWVYDVSTQAWHERASFLEGELFRHRSNCQAFFNDEVLVGDYQIGKIYAFDLETYSDDGATQKWIRSWRALPTGKNDLKRTAHHSLQLDIEAGTGLNLGQGSDPMVMLRWSDDGGHTWSNEHWVSTGKIGQYGRRANWHRLGMTMKLRDRVYEVAGTDPVKIAIMGAELDVTPTHA